jgi:Fe-S cluster biogenesis protein NfuA
VPANGPTPGCARRFKALLDREVNRSIASHGGQISIVDVRDGKLLIAMSGGCQGCTASQVTLKNGFELMVRAGLRRRSSRLWTRPITRQGRSRSTRGQGKRDEDIR